MKKHILMMLMAMLSVAPGIGQTHYEAQMSLGVHGGVNHEEKHFGFIIEANFEQRGWAENFDEAPFSYSRTINYVQIPFMSHIYFGRRHKFFINLGPSVSFKTGDSVKSNFDYSNVGSVPDFPVHTSQQYGYPTKGAVDFGISGGLGGELGITRRHSIYLEARYYFGIANVLPAGRTDHFKSSNPMALSISLGYWFRMK